VPESEKTAVIIVLERRRERKRMKSERERAADGRAEKGEKGRTSAAAADY